MEGGNSGIPTAIGNFFNLIKFNNDKLFLFATLDLFFVLSRIEGWGDYVIHSYNPFYILSLLCSDPCYYPYSLK